MKQLKIPAVWCVPSQCGAIRGYLRFARASEQLRIKQDLSFQLSPADCPLIGTGLLSAHIIFSSRKPA
ncbi:hypothetical protein ABQG12_15615 [Xanthomonas nasturtii]